MFLQPDHDTEYRSLAGAIFSLLTFLLVISYAAYKIVDLMQFNDYTLQLAEKEKFYETEVSLSPSDGFNLAAAVTAYDGSDEIIEDPSIGTVKMYIKYALTEEGVLGFRELLTRQCNPTKDFNDIEGSNDDSKFFILDPDS